MRTTIPQDKGPNRAKKGRRRAAFAAMFVFDEDGTESDCDTILGVCDELDRKEQA